MHRSIQVAALGTILSLTPVFSQEQAKTQPPEPLTEAHFNRGIDQILHALNAEEDIIQIQDTKTSAEGGEDAMMLFLLGGVVFIVGGTGLATLTLCNIRQIKTQLAEIRTSFVKTTSPPPPSV